MRILLSVLAGMFLMAFCATKADANFLETELVVNGGAESGDETGWMSNGIQAVTTTGPAQGFGDFAFTAGGGPAAGQTLQQSIDVGALSQEIDNGEITSSFSIYLQSRSMSGAQDIAEATLFFLNDLSAPIASVSFQDTTNLSVFDWDRFSDVRVVPAGTRSIDILLNATRTAGSSSDGFFDEVSLRLVPEPSSLALLSLGGACLLRCRRVA